MCVRACVRVRKVCVSVSVTDRQTERDRDRHTEKSHGKECHTATDTRSAGGGLSGVSVCPVVDCLGFLSVQWWTVCPVVDRLGFPFVRWWTVLGFRLASGELPYTPTKKAQSLCTLIYM